MPTTRSQHSSLPHISLISPSSLLSSLLLSGSAKRVSELHPSPISRTCACHVTMRSACGQRKTVLALHPVQLELLLFQPPPRSGSRPRRPGLAPDPQSARPLPDSPPRPPPSIDRPNTFEIPSRRLLWSPLTWLLYHLAPGVIRIQKGGY